MARCHLVIGLCVLHLCLALSYGGFEFNPGLIPQAQGYYPNPYAQYSYSPSYNSRVPRAEYGYPPQQPYEEGQYGEYPGELLQVEEDQTPSASTGGVASTSTPATPSSSDTASVQTPTDTANSDSTGSSSTPTSSNQDALDIQLAAALDAVKADMISKGKQVLEEKQWTDDVKGVIETYTKKIQNVYANIEKLKKDMGDLYKKKNQIINAQIQKSLTAKLKDSNDDLRTVQAALDKVTNTQMEFEQSKKDIQTTIDDIFAQLAELKGTPAPATTGTSESAAGSSDGSQTSATPASSQAAAGTNSDSSSTDTTSTDPSAYDSDIVDRTAEINSKIDTIKSIVSALNK